jgi:Transglycosylase SLT domain
MNRRARPAVVGGGLVAACAAAAAAVAVLTGAHGGPAAMSAGAGLAPASPSAHGSLPGASEPAAGRARASSGQSADPTSLTGATTRLIVPDVIASVPGGVSIKDLARLRRLSGVRVVLAIDGARITVNGAPLTVLAAPAAALRPWTPPATAGDAAVWSGFAAGDLITTTTGARSAGLVPGGDYPVVAGVRTTLTVGAPAVLPIAGVDAIINQARGRTLGLVRDIAVLVNAPATDPVTLAARVKAALGASSTVIRLVPAEVSTSLPVDATPSTGRPTSYLQLFKESATQYCPGLSWTVLAAIGQIESADGTNVGPSTAGALGPMQFLPSTWRTWGTDGFGDTGAPDIMNPFDAVPSAARLLCADGAAGGGQQLRNAIFDYNHATWYVDEVLTLAAEYAREPA